MNLRNNNFRSGVASRWVLMLALFPLWWWDCAGTERANLSALGNRPLSFELNQGQYGEGVSFVARGPAYSLSLSPTEVSVVLQKNNPPLSAQPRAFGAINRAGSVVSYRQLRIALLGANPQAQIAGVGEVAGRVNYFLGNDPGKWRTSVPAFERVRVTEVFPGINLLHYGNQQHLEYDFEVAPGANPGTIALRFTGPDNLSISAAGELVLSLGTEEIRQPKPVIYQTVHGERKSIAGGYVLTDPHTVKFSVADYDKSLPLVIDPVVSYSKYIGDTSNDSVYAGAVDADGNIYLAGETISTALASSGAFQTNVTETYFGDAFVAKLRNAASSSSLFYITYLGGLAYEAAFAVAADGAGNAYVTGYTASTNFPTRAAFQPNIAGRITPGFTLPAADAFITKLGPYGSNLVFSTFFGGSGGGYYGSGDDIGYGIALDAATNIYVVGSTFSTNLPVRNTSLTNQGGLEDGFLLKLEAAGTNLIYAMYLGGTSRDYARDVVVDPAGNPIVIGYTASPNFPVTTNAVQTLFNNTTNGSAADDVFVAQVQSGSGVLNYATFLGGTNNDEAYRVATDATGAAYVIGTTLSGDFPRTTTNIYSALLTNTTAADAFVTKLDFTATNLAYSLTFGGTGRDEGRAIAVDSTGRAHVVGNTDSLNFPTNGLFGILRGTNSGGTDVFLAELNPNGTAFDYAAYLGGKQNDLGYGVALDAGGNAYFVGQTVFSTFPIEPAIATGNYSDVDGFIVKIGVATSLTIASAGANVEVSWPSYAGEFTLQSTTNLSLTNGWINVATASALTNYRYVVTLPASNAPAFFRLNK